MGDAQNAVALQGITKRFGNVTANNNVSLQVRRGEIHAIVGENGAGKSTLMKILAGVSRPDAGNIVVNSRTISFRNPSDAIAAGIGMVFQHFRLVQDFTVAENVLLGMETAATLRRHAMESAVEVIAQKFGLRVTPQAKVENLGVGEQQRVEILKVLYRNAQVVILDEPTAVLTPGEVVSFFDTVRQLRAAGATIILITHKLNEVMELCDSVTVLRQGRVVSNQRVSDSCIEELARVMVGDSHAAADLTVFPRPSHEQQKEERTVLEVRGLVPSSQGNLTKRPQSFSVAAGQIVGIAGVEGNGQTELIEALVGLRNVDAGDIWLNGKNVVGWSVKSRRKAGFAYIPEDRQRRGLVLDFTLRENLQLGCHWKETRFPAGRSRTAIVELLKSYDVKPADPSRRARELSGGNQQKLVAARELSRCAALLIASQPTRGVDIGAARVIHDHIKAQRSSGAAILLVSSDLQEILALSDAIIVMFRGSIVFRSRNVDLDEQLLGWYMAGGEGSAEAEESG